MTATPKVTFAQDNPSLARDYDTTSDFQFEHGRQLVADLKLRQGEQVLDVGAGTGRLALHMAELVGPSGLVVAIDPLADRVALARSRAGGSDGDGGSESSSDRGRSRARVQVAQARAEDLGAWPDGHFDAVVLNSVFHWIADQPTALAEAWRVLRPGGRLALNSADADRPHAFVALLAEGLARQGIPERQGLVPPHVINGDRLHQLLEQAGFVEIRVTPFTFHDRFVDLEHLLRWNRSSFFGNFLPHLELNGPLQDALREALAARTDREGIHLERHLVFAWARKPGQP